VDTVSSESNSRGGARAVAMIEGWREWIDVKVQKSQIERRSVLRVEAWTGKVFVRID
jgi:hypothetical protein